MNRNTGFCPSMKACHFIAINVLVAKCATSKRARTAESKCLLDAEHRTSEAKQRVACLENNNVTLENANKTPRRGVIIVVSHRRVKLTGLKNRHESQMTKYKIALGTLARSAMLLETRCC